MHAALLGLVASLVMTHSAHATDPVVETGVAALAQLTDPQRLEALPDETFRAQLGPALGWLNAVRRRDVSPEAAVARAFLRNGLEGERARLTREALLRNLARADAWELFDHAESASALVVGKPASISAGIHRGHVALAAVILPEGLGSEYRREFACLVLRADDERPPRPPLTHHRQPGDLLARLSITPPPAGVSKRRTAALPVADGNDPLPVVYTTTGQDDGRILVRENVTVGQEVSLAALGGPARRFLLRGVDEQAVRFELLGDPAGGPATTRAFAVPLTPGQPVDGGTRVWRIYDEPGGLRISLSDAVAGSVGNTRTVRFEFPPASARVDGPVK